MLLMLKTKTVKRKKLLKLERWTGHSAMPLARAAMATTRVTKPPAPKTWRTAPKA
jgi:hypothetical protein